MGIGQGVMKDNQATEIDAGTGRSAVSEMIALQRRIFERQRDIIEANESHESRGFKKYRDAYIQAVSSYSSLSGFGALCDAIAAARIAYVADYHTLRLAQRTFVKLIRGIMHQVDHICLAMEFVPQDYQKDLNRFMKGKITESTFLRRIQYRQNWPYDIWPNFKPIFEMAIDLGLPMIAIDSDPALPISERDLRAGELITEAAQRFPDATILAYCGQMHMAPPHLPAAVDEAFLKSGMGKPKRVIVYQNAEEIYWQLASEGLEGVEVVQIDENSFCVNNTPPLVQQLSYLHWIRIDEELLEYSELEITVKTLIRNLGRFIGVPFQAAAKAVRVFMPGDLDLMDALKEGGLGDIEKEQVKQSIASEQSACIVPLNIIYLATLSLNHAAEEAAHYLKQSVSNSKAPDELKDRFYFYTLNEACGFFGSKVINPKRKTDHQGKLRRIVAHGRKKSGRMTAAEKAAKFALAHMAFESGRGPLTSATVRTLANPAVFHAAAHILGYILGDRLYYGLTSGVVTKQQIRRLFTAKMDGPGEALEEYLRLASETHSVKIPRRI